MGASVPESVAAAPGPVNAEGAYAASLRTAFTHAALSVLFGAFVEVACVIAAFPTAAFGSRRDRGPLRRDGRALPCRRVARGALSAAVDRVVPRRMWPSKWTLLL